VRASMCQLPSGAVRLSLPFASGRRLHHEEDEHRRISLAG
jgi:hypothetical protein